MHTMERYFSGAETVEPTDSMAEGLMRSMLELSRRVVRDPRDYDARAGIMWAGSLSHNSLTGCGRGGRGRIGDWASHQLEHELSGMFDVTHGAGLAAVWGAWSRYVMDAAPERFARFARAVMGVDTPGSDEETALAGIRAFEHFLRSIGIKTSYEDGLTTLSLDENALREALEQNPDQVKDAFTKSKENGAASDGLMASIQKVTDRYAATTGDVKGILIEKAGSQYSPTAALDNTLLNQMKEIDEQIEKWQDKMSNKVDYYTNKFTQLEVLIQQMNSQSSTLSGLMGGY